MKVIKRRDTEKFFVVQLVELGTLMEENQIH